MLVAVLARTLHDGSCCLTASGRDVCSRGCCAPHLQLYMNVSPVHVEHIGDEVALSRRISMMKLY